MKKRILSLTLALALCLGLVTPTFAAGQKTVHASTTEELLGAIQSNTIITLDGKEYNLGYGGLWIGDVSNLTIKGTKGTRIVSNSGGDTVIDLMRSQNIVLDNLVLGHDIPPEDHCTTGVVAVTDSSFSISNCDIYGCGWVGLIAGSSTGNIKDTTIRDCSHDIAHIYDSVCSFENCIFSGNGYAEKDAQALQITGPENSQVFVTFTGCTFKNNYNSSFAWQYLGDPSHVPASPLYSLVNCTFTGNGWGAMSNTGASTNTKPEPIVGSFSDVKQSAWYASQVQWAVDKKITSGTSDTTFSPNQTCTQGQIITMLWAAEGKPDSDWLTSPYPNVKDTDYFYDAVRWAYDKGLLLDETFDPNAPCTRATTVTYLWLNAGRPIADNAADFSDVDADAPYANAVAWAVETGVTAGMGNGTFGFDVICNRAQIVTFLYAALEK